MMSKTPLRYSRPLIVSTSLFCVINSASAKVIFKADFETGDLGEWSETGTRSQNATPRNVQVVTDIVQEGKYTGKFTIHEDDLDLHSCSHHAGGDLRSDFHFEMI
jgi:hypothetical protein